MLAPAVEIRSGTVEVGDGVRLAYDEAGSGTPPVVLVHGMACERTQMRRQLEHLAPRHRVVAVDLRGHGESDKLPGSYTFADLAEDLLALMGALGISRPVLIGHSLGGSISLLLAVAHPDDVAGVVLLDSGVRGPDQRTVDLAPFYDTLGGPDHAERVHRFVVEHLFEPGEDPATVEAVATSMAATEPHVFLAMARGVLAYDGAATSLACGLPAMHVLGPHPFVAPGAIEALGPNWWVGRVVGVGHFMQMLGTDQVHPMIDRFMERFGQ